MLPAWQYPKGIYSAVLKLLVISFLVSAFIGLWLLRRPRVEGGQFSDSAAAEAHKVHRYSVPRLGGVLIFSALVVATICGFALGFLDPTLAVPLLLAALPAFAIGLFEDLRRGIPPWARLTAAFASALLGVALAGATMTRLDLPWLDIWLLWTPFAVVATVFAVGGVTQAFNIIDGLNGLAGGIAFLVVGALVYVAIVLQDVALAHLGLMIIGGVLGFLIWNYPSGQIFLGDGGAYLLGFLIAEMSLLLVLRHPEVSAWFPLLLIIYPVWETVFSIYRRKLVRRRAATSADRLHLHTLLYKRLSYGLAYRSAMGRCRQRNSDVSVFAWLLAMAAVAPAILFWGQTLLLQALTALFCLYYVWLYRRLVRFRANRRDPDAIAGKLAQVPTAER